MKLKTFKEFISEKLFSDIVSNNLSGLKSTPKFKNFYEAELYMSTGQSEGYNSELDFMSKLPKIPDILKNGTISKGRFNNLLVTIDNEVEGIILYDINFNFIKKIMIINTYKDNDDTKIIIPNLTINIEDLFD